MTETIIRKIHRTAEVLQKEVEAISDYIFHNPELGDFEFKSVEYLTGLLKEKGFEVEMPYCGLETAFRASLKLGEGPTIAFLAEYDALPGFGPHGESGHACGHNWIAASSAGAGLLLSALKDIFQGTVVVLGTPAEETAGRKVDMIKGGAFDDVDVAFQMHLENETDIETKSLAMDAIEFRFKGLASHAASNPYDGINALDAVQLTFAGINALRQHVKSDVRIHGIVTEGGMAPNIVPDNAACRFYVRSEKRSDLNEVSRKVFDCARGASIMTGTEMTHHYFENHFDDMINNSVLVTIMEESLSTLGIHPPEKKRLDGAGSSDIGNVSHVCPTCYVNLGYGDGPGVHQKGFLDIANGKKAKILLMKSIVALGIVSVRISSDLALQNRIKMEFFNKTEE